MLLMVQQKNSEASWEITLLPHTIRQLSDNDRLLILLIYVVDYIELMKINH